MTVVLSLGREGRCWRRGRTTEVAGPAGGKLAVKSDTNQTALPEGGGGGGEVMSHPVKADRIQTAI